MELGPARGTEGILEGGAHQGVSEVVPADPGLAHQPGGDGGAERLGHAGLRGAPGLGQDHELKAFAQRRRHGESIGGLIGQVGEAPSHQVADAVGNVQLGERLGGNPAALTVDDGPLFGEVAKHLPDEERVALVNDRSIWPDRDGGCPAGPPACLTSLAAIRAAQRKGQVGPDIPTNAYFFFSVHPEAR